MSVVFTTASGYIINDYFDRKVDSINRPKEVIIGKYIKRRTVIIHHSLLNLLAILLSFYVSINVGMYKIGFISVFATIILWLYSTHFKRLFFVGNFVVAGLTALMPILAAIFDIALLNRKFHSQVINYHNNFSEITFWVIGFAFFAFILNLIREIVKDIEDKDGDKAFHRKTIPIVLGLFYTKTVVLFLEIITIISIIVAYSKYLHDNVSLWYITSFLILPLLYILFQTLKAKEKEDFHKLSILIKILMMLGMFYSFVILYDNL
jgi:4-hydroxybenzoate polyprenyltransferase